MTKPNVKSYRSPFKNKNRFCQSCMIWKSILSLILISKDLNHSLVLWVLVL